MCAVDASGRYDDCVKRQNVVPVSDKECLLIVPQGLGCLERSREEGHPAAEGVDEYDGGKGRFSLRVFVWH